MSSTTTPCPGIELRNPEIQRNPYPYYASMREHYPVCVLADGQYALTRWDDVVFALTRADVFSSAITKISAAEWLNPECRREMFLLSKDPPEHTVYRSLINKAFVGKVLHELIPLMRRTARALLESIKNREVEFVGAFAYPYVGAIIGRLNVSDQVEPLADIQRNVELRELMTPERPGDSYAEAVEQSLLRQNAHFDAIFRDRRIAPKEDIATLLLQAKIDGNPLPPNELRDALDLFTAAGFHTTAQLLASAMVYLARKPNLKTALTAMPALIPQFIEELLRFDGPTHRVLRTTKEAYTLHGITIPKGALVSVIIAAADHDPQQFADPENFDITRHNNRRHLQFGSGVHVCIGAALARLEIKIALEEILASINHVECTPDDALKYTGTMTTRGLRELQVTLR